MFGRHESITQRLKMRHSVIATEAALYDSTLSLLPRYLEISDVAPTPVPAAIAKKERLRG
jgi:hypothetical protein